VDDALVFFIFISSVETLDLPDTHIETLGRFLVGEFTFVETLNDTDTAEFIVGKDDC